MNTWIVIPCYNEAERLDFASIETLATVPGVNIILVDDGSDDNTWALFEDVKARLHDKVELLRMIHNLGKAEAVRRGMNHAVALGAELTGYIDADFATPAQEMLRLIRKIVDSDSIGVLLGSRWLHLGAYIDRSSFRHYAGRVFATLASNVLKMPVYDTQCGTKLFRVTDTFLAAVDLPFISRWAFDVELIGRLREGTDGAAGYELERFIEEPLGTWRHTRGSKISLFDMVQATFELFAIFLALKRLRSH